MRVVYSPEHRSHDPEHEVVAGVQTPAYETPGRVEAIREALEADGGSVFERPADHGVEPILAVHDPGLVRFLETAWDDWSAQGHRGPVIADTFAHPGLREGMEPGRPPRSAEGRAGFWSFETMTPITAGTHAAARIAVDVALTAADRVLEGDVAAYALCRPPGHHAARSVFGGYCFFNNAAIAAEHLARRTGRPVAILDLDYHHGNGTQQIFYGRADVLYASLHGDPDRAYPHFTGFADETGAGDGEGATLNVPLPAGCDDPTYLAHLDLALEAVAGHPAEIVVVSLGQDTHGEDPITDLALTTSVYQEVGRRVADLGRRVVVIQEGGYRIPVLGPSAVGFLRGIEGRDAAE